MEPEKIQFSHYRALKLIGKGSVGEVYLADDSQAKRQVAAKIISIETLKVERAANVNMLRQFLREVAASAKLDHPNILPIGDHGEATLEKSPIAYVVMPYRPEGSLSAWLSQNAQKQANWRPTPRQVVHIIRQTGAALQHAHDHKIMHLDVKPTNLLIHNRSTIDEYPDILLSDFGSASLVSATQARGTSAYIAPEQWDNKPLFASDQYALGALAYELLTGNPPFQGARKNGADTPGQERLKPVSDSIPQLSPDVDLALQRALAKKPEERFPSVTAFTQALQAALQNLTASGEHRSLSNPPTPAQQAPTRPEANGDIRATLSISPQEAHDGVVRTFNLPNGQKIEVQIPAGAQDEQVITLNGKGEVPAPGVPAGNLYLRLSLLKLPAVAPSARTTAASPMPDSAPAKTSTPAPPTPLPTPPHANMPQQGAVVSSSASPSNMATPPTPPTPAPLTPLPVTLRPNMAQGPASIAPLPPFPPTPRPNVAQGPASAAPLSPPPMATLRPNAPQGPASAAPLSPPPMATLRPNAPQGPASAAPLSPPPMATPRPNMAQGPASIAPLSPPPNMATPRPNVAQGPASVAPLSPPPMATPRPNVAQGPASIAPLSPPPNMATPRPNMAQGPASIAPLSPPMATPRPNVAQGPASIAPLSPPRNAFARQTPDMSPPAPTTPQLRRANSPFAVIVMIGLLLIALGVGSYGALTSNWALIQNILYGTPAPTVSSTYNQITPTVPGKTTSSVWHAQPSGTQQELVSVAWADTRFATVGSNGTILTSPNGNTWTAEHSGTTQFLWSVTWSGSLLVTVGTAGTILTSPDGITWTTQHSGTTQDLWNVNWVDGSIFVAVGTGGTILTSKDGHTWATQQSNSGQILDGIGWSGSVLAVVGTNGLIITSTDDGTTWTIQNSGTQQLLESIAWVNNRFVAVGTNGTILTSSQGIAWTIQNSTVTQNLSGVSGSGSQFVIVGDNGTILTSAKGTTWAVQPSGTAQHLLSIAISTTTFAATSTTPIPTIPVLVAVGNHGTILLGP